MKPTEPHYTEDTYQGDMLERLLELVAAQLVHANCVEILCGSGTYEDAWVCAAPTLKSCTECEMPICEHHSIPCRGCAKKFCQVCYQSHVCVPTAEDLDRVAEENLVRDRTAGHA